MKNKTMASAATGLVTLVAAIGLLRCSGQNEESQPGTRPRPGESAASPSPAPVRPDILLVTVDTLRADHVSAYGHKSPTTPFLDSLARRGVLYKKVYSTTSWTVPALASILTSTYAHRHGMDQRGATRGARKWSVFPESLVTLPEALSAAGYSTFGLTANFSLPPERGFGRGFDRYQCVGAVGIEGVRPTFDAWLPEINRARPWFIWLHLFDPHAPYLARQRWLPEFWPEPKQRYNDLDGLAPGELNLLTLDEERMDYVRALYDSEIRHVDEFVGEVFKRIPRADNAMFVLSSDHGEEFLEHGGMGHGITLFEESTRVPLIVKYPGDHRAGTIVQEPVSIVDILPTILAAAGLDPMKNIDGVDLGPAADGVVSKPRWLLAELQSRENLQSITDGRWKLVSDIDNPSASRLFDLENDPEEKNDLSRKMQDRVKVMENALARAGKATKEAGSETEITAEQREALRALGYLQ